MKKLLSLFIAVVMVFSMFPPTVRALTQDDTNSFAVSNASVEVDGTEDKVVEIKFYGTSSDTYATISGTFGKSDATNKIVLSGLNAGYTVDDFTNYADVTTGAFKLSQPAVGATFDAEAPIVTATYTVPKDTPVGEYKVSVYVETSENFNGDYLDDATYAATIKVTSGGGNTPTTGDYAIWYELDSTAADTDSDNYKEYATGADVTATVKIQNNTNKAVVLQAYDIYLSYNANLLYQSTNLTSGVAYKTTNGVDAVAAANDVITHIQAVGSDAEKPIEIPMEAGATVELGTITFKIADAAVYGTDMPINLTIGTNNKTYTNIGVGTDVAVGGGDKVSYYPTNGGTHLGAEVNTTYTVLWKNDDGSILETDTVGHNVMPEYNGDTPTKAADDQYTYTFDKWSPTVAAATGAATYTATYTTTTNSYTITWNNWDNTLLTTTTVAYGETPSYTGTTPTKAADDKYTYVFKEWTPAISAVSGETTYTARYTPIAKRFTITLNVNGGTLADGANASIEYTADESVTLPIATLAGKNFGGWKVDSSVGSWTAESYSGSVGTGMYGDVSLTAIWSSKDYTVSADDSVTNGTVSAANADTASGMTANEGETINVTVTPNAGYVIGSVTYKYTLNGEEKTETINTDNGAYSFTMPAADVIVSATFVEDDLAITVNNTTDANGTVSSDKTIAHVRDTVTLSNTPNAGYELKEYKVTYIDGNNQEQTVAVNTDGTFTMPAYPVTVTATFQKKSLDITFATVDHGSASAQDGDGNPITTAKLGESVTLVPIADTGYELASWTVTYNNGTENVNVTVTGSSFTMPEYPVTVTASYTAISYTITYMDGEKEIIGLTPTTYTIESTDKLPTYSKNNYTFEGWKVTSGANDKWAENSVIDAETALTGYYGTVTLTAQWDEAITYAIDDYKYAKNGYVMLRIATNSNANAYTFNSESMYYTTDSSYLVSGSDASGVFYTLISADYVSNGKLTEAGMAKLVAGTEAAKTIDYTSGDINGDGVTNIADANIVYQMIVNGGGYYTDLSANNRTDTESRLMADMNKEAYSSSVARATIADVNAIVAIINGTATN